MSQIYPVILSGGSGTRLWPLSRRQRPKQFLALVSPRSLLQETALRLGAESTPPVTFGPLVMIGNSAHKEEAETQLAAIGMAPHLHVLEPLGRNTAPAAAIAALVTGEVAPDALLILLPADHHVENRAAFRHAVAAGAPAAAEGRIVTFGIIPTAPEMGYGYIHHAKETGKDGVYPVLQFVEKPDRATAERYIATGDYLWNSGMFLARADVLLAEMRRYCPAVVDACEGAIEHGRRTEGALHLDPDAFAACPSISVDYAVMEHTTRASVLPVSMGWSDVGSFQGLWELTGRDDSGNVLMGRVVAADTRNCYIRSEKRLIATVGVEDLVIIETDDSLLVARRDKVQDIRAIIDRLAKDDSPER